jgi:hypothetical protein
MLLLPLPLLRLLRLLLLLLRLRLVVLASRPCVSHEQCARQRRIVFAVFIAASGCACHALCGTVHAM